MFCLLFGTPPLTRRRLIDKTKASYLLRPPLEEAAPFCSGNVEGFPLHLDSIISVLGQPRVPRVFWRSSARGIPQLGQVGRSRDEPGIGETTEITEGGPGQIYQKETSSGVIV